MTTIAAASVMGPDGMVHALAADGCHMYAGGGVAGDEVEKLFASGANVLAGAGDARILNLLGCLGPTDSPSAFVDAIEAAMKSSGFTSREEYGAPAYGQAFYFMNDVGIWEVCGSLSTTRVEEAYPSAIGTGCEWAGGAMEERALSAYELVRLAIRVATKRDSSTGGKIMMALRGAETFGPERV